MRFTTYSFRFAEEVLNSKLVLKQEITQVLSSLNPNLQKLSRPQMNQLLKTALVAKRWQAQPLVFNVPGDPTAKLDFLKERIGVEVEFGHSSFLGIDLLKFQVCSYSGLDKIDVGIYIVSTHNFQNDMITKHGQNWKGSLSFEKVKRYLPHFKSAIQVPVYVIGIDA
jgi:Restriction endonuclease BglII